MARASPAPACDGQRRPPHRPAPAEPLRPATASAAAVPSARTRPLRNRALVPTAGSRPAAEHVLAVEILVQAVVVVDAILQQQRRRPRLPGIVAAFQERLMAIGIARCRSPSSRSSDWRPVKPRVELGAQLRDQVGQRIGEILVLAAAEAVARPSRSGCGSSCRPDRAWPARRIHPATAVPSGQHSPARRGRRSPAPSRWRRRGRRFPRNGSIFLAVSFMAKSLADAAGAGHPISANSVVVPANAETHRRGDGGGHAADGIIQQQITGIMGPGVRRDDACDRIEPSTGIVITSYPWLIFRFSTGSSSSNSKRSAGRMPPLAANVPPNIAQPSGKALPAKPRAHQILHAAACWSSVPS